MARKKKKESRPFRCSHFTSRRTRLEKNLARIKSHSESSKSLTCKQCRKKVTGPLGRLPTRRKEAAALDSSFRWACLDCGDVFCGVEDEFYPDGHVREHALVRDHPMSVRLDRSSEVRCYECSVLPRIRAEARKARQRKKQQREAARPASESKTRGRVKKLPNYGNTCFFNSILQNLFAMAGLRRYLEGLDRPAGQVTASLKDLFAAACDDSIDAVYPVELLDLVRGRGNFFAANTEHDSHELLVYLLDALRSEGAGGVDEMFVGELSSILRCARCENTSTTYELFLDLSLPVPSKVRSTERDAVIAPRDEAGMDEAQISTSPSGPKQSSDSPEAKPLPPTPDVSDSAPLATWPKSRKRRSSSGGKAREKADKEEPNVPVSLPDPKASTGEGSETPREKISPVVSPSVDPGFGPWRGDDEVCEVDDTGVPVSVNRCLELFTEPEDLPEGHCERCSGVFQPNFGSEKASDSPTSEQKKDGGSDGVPDLQKVGSESAGKKGSGSPGNMGDEKRNAGGGEHGAGEDTEVKTKFTKRFLINRTPPILTIHLKRFKQTESGELRKIQGHVIFEEMLDLTPYMDHSSTRGDEKCIYRLTGVVEHLGRSLSTGHYIACVRQGDDAWFRASDYDVGEVPFQEVLERDAYLLFFERQ